jgi:hypothetical protein
MLQQTSKPHFLSHSASLQGTGNVSVTASVSDLFLGYVTISFLSVHDGSLESSSVCRLYNSWALYYFTVTSIKYISIVRTL